MTLTRESKVRITSTAPPLMVRAIGWCEDCGDVEVEPMCETAHTSWKDTVPVQPWLNVLPGCCHYADCPLCGADVDQWAWQA